MKTKVIKTKWHWWAEVVFWRLLKHSGIFWYWYTDFLMEVIYNFEIADIEQKEMINKYTKKLRYAKKRIPKLIFSR